MCGRPAITGDCGIIPNKLKGIGTVRINCPELPIAQERNFVASYMPGTTCCHAGKEKQQKYKNSLIFHERSIALLPGCVKRKLLTTYSSIFYANASIFISYRTALNTEISYEAS